MRFLTGTVAIATVLATTGIVVGPAAGAAEPPPVCAAEQSGEAQAAAMAHACGQRVEVLAKRTEYAQVFANPSGTFTIEQHAAPVRVRTRSGSWTPIDTRLRKLPDGSLAPAATLADVRFSGGGNAAAVSLSNSRGRLELNWPATLPVPRIDGDSAVYPEVLPGVDLRVQALASGFTHVLVVRTREAAADPALRRIRYSLASPGLASRPAGDGFELVDSSGTAVVRGGAPLMWDSRGDDSGPAASTARAPGDQARTVRARLSIPAAADKRDVVIEPDADLLADPAAVLPIYIDPYYETAWHHWTFANSTNTSNDRVTQRVGRSPDNGALYRTFIEFPTATLHGKHVLSARFYAKLVHSWSCASTPVSLYWTASVPMADRVGWSPGLWRHLDERSAHAHKGSADCGNQPDVNMEFAGGLAGLLQEAANGYWGPITLGLAARRADGSAESTTSYWKKFDPGAPRMTAEYNSYPNTPTDRTIDNQACATGDGR
ncbi:MAG TPA: hypothetical protein VF062_27100, partial [Candidatus Limnocylindrales bacterium]